MTTIYNINRYALMMMFMALFSNVSFATTIEVLNANNAGGGSLRRAVLDAVNGDTIIFDSAINGDTIKLITEIIIDTNLVIIGNDTRNTIIDGMDNSRIFHIPVGDTVSIIGLTLQNGNGIGASTSDNGGAVFNEGYTQLTDVTIKGSSANSVGGGIFNLFGTLILSQSTISDNTANDGGGVISITGHATITNTRIMGNTASGGGGVRNVRGEMAISHTIISGNMASVGGGLRSNSGNTTLSNVTISGNTASGDGGAISNSQDTMTIVNTTLTGNKAGGRGGGIILASDTTILTNSIIARNIDNGTGPDIFAFGGTINGTNTLIGDGTGLSGITDGINGNQVGTAIEVLDPLFVMDVDTLNLPNTTGDLRLQCISSAIDAGTPDTTGLNLGSTDITGSNRVNGNQIDIGAYEAIINLSVDNELLSQENLPMEIRAFSSIQSDGTIADGKTFNFNAGEQITLLELFEVELGGTFEAQIESCNP